jgi:hypothetical protein
MHFFIENNGTDDAPIGKNKVQVLESTGTRTGTVMLGSLINVPVCG